MATNTKLGTAALPTGEQVRRIANAGKDWKAEAAAKARSLKAEAIKAHGAIMCHACYGTGVNLFRRNAAGECGRKVGESTYSFPICEVCYGDRNMPDIGAEDLAAALLDMLLNDGYRLIQPDGQTVKYGTVHYERQVAAPKPRRTSLPK